jgi:uncharacterized membrane protein
MIMQGSMFSQSAYASKLALIAMLLLLCSCSRKAEESAPTAAPSSAPIVSELMQMNTKVDSPAQSITSSVSQVTLQPGELTSIPVTVTNMSRTPWSSVGTYPVHISYHWDVDAKRLPDEGERTKLPHVLKPGESVSVNMAVAPPSQKGEKLSLVVSVVQEGVAWFDIVGAQPLKIPAQIVAAKLPERQGRSTKGRP